MQFDTFPFFLKPEVCMLAIHKLIVTLLIPFECVRSISQRITQGIASSPQIVNKTIQMGTTMVMSTHMQEPDARTKLMKRQVQLRGSK